MYYRIYADKFMSTRTTIEIAMYKTPLPMCKHLIVCYWEFGLAPLYRLSVGIVQIVNYAFELAFIFVFVF